MSTTTEPTEEDLKMAVDRANAWLRDQGERLADARAEAALLRKDAARLDWLEANPEKKLESFRWKGEWVYWVRGHDSDTHSNLRSAIDAAMEASK